jgi:plastocyanin
MRRFLFAAALLAAVGAVACGGYGDSPSAPGLETPPAGAIVIDVVAINGSQSFSPNPATVPAGLTVAWHNIDTTTHRVVLNDGKLDTGNIAPGRFSAPMTLAAPGPYHCSIHPEMIGTVTTVQ